MRQRNCIICGSEDFKVIYKNKHDRFVKFIEGKDTVSYKVTCRKCSLVFQNPVFTNEELRKIYSADYGNLMGYGSLSPSEKFIKEKSYRACEQFRWISDNIDFSSIGAKSVLEVGCSAGLLLNLFSKSGWQAEGVEPSVHFADYARKNFSLKIYPGLVEEADIPKNRYDLILASHFLEHTLDPIAALRLLASFVKDGGFLFIEVPNLGGIWKNMDDQLQSTHIFIPSIATMRRMIAVAGLKIAKEEGIKRIVRYLLRKGAAESNFDQQIKDNNSISVFRFRVQLLTSRLLSALKMVGIR